jgi:hypothetical protein
MSVFRNLIPVLVLSLWIGGALAADKQPRVSNDNAYAAAKSAEIEILKVRASGAPMGGAAATLMEADDLLRRFRQAPAAEKEGLRAQLDTSLARAELELSRMR